ncbi:hypothetical protein [Streptomyces sp. NPDC086787]|uniref:hypothetical protein n=1 Tax=Streptomyces sp. NPDC086787 TaxID=3365759 RepID=UPI0038280B78
MRKSPGMRVVGTAVCLLTLCTVSPAAAGGNAGTGGRDHEVIRLTSPTEVRYTLTPATQTPPVPAPIGNQQVSTATVYKDHVAYGTQSKICTVVGAQGDLETQVCNGVLTLPQGKITWSDAETSTGSPDDFYDAVTGGTGAYDRARGVIHVERDPNVSGGRVYTVYLAR